MSQETHSSRVYWIVYGALMLLLAATVGFAFVDFGRYINNAIAMVIALMKGTLIVLFFMHLRWRPWITWFFAFAGFLWLGILLTLTSSDYLTRNHPAGDCPKGEPTFLSVPSE